MTGIRLNSRKPSPYLKEVLPLILKGRPALRNSPTVDLGCGNGRNSEFLRQEGFDRVFSYDKDSDYGDFLDLELGMSFCPTGWCSLILLNYVAMFLDPKKLPEVVGELDRIAADRAFLVIELYEAKGSHYKTHDGVKALGGRIAYLLGDEWTLFNAKRGLLHSVLRKGE